VRDKSKWTRKAGERHGRGVACNIYDGRTHIAYVVDVAVDGSGHVKVERVVAAVDCGLVVNPIGVEQQIEGGIIWGIPPRSEDTLLSRMAQPSNRPIPISQWRG